MNLPDLIGPLSGIGTILTLILAYKSGLLEFLLNWRKNGNGKETYTQAQMEAAKLDSEWKGEITETLKFIKTELPKLSERLTKHLDNEEDDVRRIWEELKRLSKRRK